MTTALFTHPDCHKHVTPTGHPERVARLDAIFDALSHPDFAALDRREAPLGREADVLRAHPQAHLDAVKAAIPAQGLAPLDADTFVSPGSYTAAMRAVGGICAAVDAVMAGEVANAFCAMRPPGHHAERQTPMGFCLFGTVAIAARYALDAHGLSRVAVLDFDVHHGNGTQDLLWDEARTLFVSSHQMPLYPGSGARSERGAHDNVVNIPLDPGTAGPGFHAAWEPVFERLDRFAPELVLVSAGFDAHRADPLANLMLTEADFAANTRRIGRLAKDHAGGRIVSTLEGGYDLDALAASTAAHVAELMEAGQ